MSSNEIIIYHSPDADDAFMFYGLVSGEIAALKKWKQFSFKSELCDIQTLNERSIKGELDCTAVSVHAFAHLAKDFAILRSGASMGGQDYGPRIVAKNPISLFGDKPLRIASPGKQTSAHHSTIL